MDIVEIMSILPHRYPMLLLDRILEVETGKRCRGLKNVTINEAFFAGHYPAHPIMPGVLIVEAMAQAGAIIMLSDPEFVGLIPVIGSIDEARFRKQVKPGDQLIMDMELLWIKRRVGKIKGVATVDGEVATEIELTFMLIKAEG